MESIGTEAGLVKGVVFNFRWAKGLEIEGGPLVLANTCDCLLIFLCLLRLGAARGQGNEALREAQNLLPNLRPEIWTREPMKLAKAFSERKAKSLEA